MTSNNCAPHHEHGGDLLPAVDPAQLDLAGRHEAEEQHALRLHAAAKLLVKPLNGVRRP
jgi:hypothetical protein